MRKTMVSLSDPGVAELIPELSDSYREPLEAIIQQQISVEEYAVRSGARLDNLRCMLPYIETSLQKIRKKKSSSLKHPDTRDLTEYIHKLPPKLQDLIGAVLHRGITLEDFALETGTKLATIKSYWSTACTELFRNYYADHPMLIVQVTEDAISNCTNAFSQASESGEVRVARELDTLVAESEFLRAQYHAEHKLRLALESIAQRCPQTQEKPTLENASKHQIHLTIQRLSIVIPGADIAQGRNAKLNLYSKIYEEICKLQKGEPHALFNRISAVGYTPTGWIAFCTGGIVTLEDLCKLSQAFKLSIDCLLGHRIQ